MRKAIAFRDPSVVITDHRFILPQFGFGFAREAAQRSVPVAQLAVLGAVALFTGAFGYYTSLPSAPVAPVSTDITLDQPNADIVASRLAETLPVQGIVAARTAVQKAIAPAPQDLQREVELDEGQTFAGMLRDAGVPQADATAAMNALDKAHNLRLMKAGQIVSLNFIQTPRGEVLQSATFLPEATKEIVVRRESADAAKFVADVRAIPLLKHRFVANAQIRSSLYEAGDRAGVPNAVMASLIRLYSHEIDFQRDIHPGDTFQVMYDQSLTRQGKIAGEGTIVYANMIVGGKEKILYRVTFSDNSYDYFDERGTSSRRSLLRTPVAVAHVTSGFGMRMHPILGYSKMHKGIDFGAPTGTPIFAAGSGVIDEIGFKNGYGRYIRIQHNGKYETAYAHMSRFNDSIRRGSKVVQGQVIGYVGMSGRATGPHLHYEVHVNGEQVNPMSVNLPVGRTLEGKLLTAFKQGQGKIRAEFDNLQKNGMTLAEFAKSAKEQVVTASAK